MSSVTLKWIGLEEFKEALRKLPENLTEEAAGIVQSVASGAAQTVQADYPRGPTGNLKARVSVTNERSRVTTKSLVRSRAPHAHLFEYGTNRRRTNKGANRGAMPKAPPTQAMIPAIVRARARLFEALITLLEREGLVVTR